ncbi:MAG TPA: copper resistance protein CopC [Jatrophihabitantaceae bacterium]
MKKFLLLLAGLFAALLFTAPAASAHATVVASDPVDGSRLQTPPTTVSVTFDQGVTLNSEGYLRVVDQSGRRVDSGQPNHPSGVGSKIEVAVKSGLPDGTYTASFRIISADGHPVAGAIRFVVGNGTLAAAAGGSSSTVNGATSVVFDVVRWLAFAGLALLGGGWLLLTVWPEGRDDVRARRLVWVGWIATTVGAVAELLIQGPYVAGSGLGDLADRTLLDATLHTTFGTAHSIRLLLLGVLGAVLAAQLRVPERSRLAEVSAALGIGLVLTYAVSGHAESEDPRWLAMTSYAAHLTAMAVWLGGLLYLLVAVLPRREPGELRRVLPVFSRTAMVCVTVLAVSGTYQAWLGIGSIDAITSTRYGQLVLVKAVLFLVILGLANLSRVAVQRRYVRPVAYAMTDVVTRHDSDVAEPPMLARMRRSVLAETVVALGVLAVTSVLVAEPPGRAATAADHAKARSATMALGGGRTATVTLDPGKHGPVTVTVQLSPGAKPQQLTATAALPAKQLGPIAIPLKAAGSEYSASGIVLPSAGKWTITLNVRTSEFDSTVADTKIRLY